MRILTVILTALSVIIGAACATTPLRPAPPDGCHYRAVWFPGGAVRTDLGERVESVEVVMHCGRFAAINYVPNDWSVRVDGPVSEETSLHMQAGT